MQAAEDAASGPPDSISATASALRTIDREARGLLALADRLRGDLGAALTRAVEMIASSGGRVVVTGVGKSGHIARKIAATLASTGTLAFFIHAAEAGHGDLGMVSSHDVLLALSWSGESAELRTIVEYARRFGVRMIAITSSAASALGRAADVVLELPQAQEACPHGLAPTTSTVMQLALGDALAVALLEGRGFSAADFRAFHPGGKLGASLLYLRDIMHRGEELPLARPGMPMAEALLIMSAKRFGCVGVIDDSGRLVGVITDGDLRRHFVPNLMTLRVDEVMTRSPRTAGPDMMVGEALAMMNRAEHPFTVLFVTQAGKPTGIVHMHDLLRVGVA
ncbi:MAG: KpsF/GutQ family sugar-phosphate isomerase [Bauldia sp.]